MNRHEFQEAARRFRAGKISLSDFTDLVCPKSGPAIGAGKLAIPSIPVRRPDSHKGDYGHIVVIAGSRGMAGAAALTAVAALRSGAGRVTVATARSAQDTVAGFNPAVMTIGLDEDASGRILLESWKQLSTRIPAADCLVVGPGLGTSAELRELVSNILVNTRVPAIFDADGLNNVDWQGVSGKLAAPRVLTPHPGELRRMISGISNDRKSQELAAAGLARDLACVVVLKGHHSLITDGTATIHNATGNPGMATAGSGDVLSGVVAALIGQGMGGFDAATLGCHIHGAAGDVVAKRLGMHGMTAVDIMEAIPLSVQQLVEGKPEQIAQQDTV
jgi:ADP-dependent NAD(P)H-hydrate dehydratase